MFALRQYFDEDIACVFFMVRRYHIMVIVLVAAKTFNSDSAARWRTPSINVGLNYLRIFYFCKECV